MYEHKYALISVSDKTNVGTIASALIKAGYELISSGGTFKYLTDSGFKVVPVEKITGFPEGLDGRVKTLHPRIHAGILADTQLESHQEYLKLHQIAPIDFVVVNLYPFDKQITNLTPISEAIELIDIGGPTMLRAAAKNYKRVTVICEPNDYPLVIKALEENSLDEQFRLKLAAKAFAHSVNYEACISNYFEKIIQTTEFPTNLTHTFKLSHTLRYGENPHQAGALYLPTSGHYLPYTQLQGKELSYNNLLDASSAVRIVQGNYNGNLCATVVKHMNPAGIAVGSDPVDTYIAARNADFQSAMGGIVALNYPISVELANAIIETFLEIVIAPQIEPEATSILAKKKNLRVLIVPPENFAKPLFDFSFVYNEFGLLVQQVDQAIETEQDLVHKVGPLPTPSQIADALLGLRWLRHVKSNSIILIKNGVTVGIGAGQQNRVDCIRLAIKRAGELAKDSVLVSDAFLPMPDNPEVANEAGIKVIVAPLGSIKDNEILAKIEEYGMTFIQTPYRHFWH